MRTCLITNNDDLRDDIKSVFESNFKEQTLCMASDGGIARSVISNTQTDLIIVDLDAANESLDIIDYAKTQNRLCGVIAFSKSGDDFARFLASRKDINDYITFPFTCKSLSHVIKNALDKISDDYESSSSLLAEIAEEELCLEEKISGIFISIGIAPNVNGYAYLRESVKIAVKDPLSINHITKIIYPQVAEHFDSSPSKVERSMRHAISTAWNRGRIDSLNNLFGMRLYSDIDRPTNGEFIALIADKLLLDGA